ncbi:MAG: zinc ribbon domain-containing protein [Candidatus Omnitrophica bacterium]|nr:zinc ribbon domain-containing protein [Candidatus Omnitrophota bacterium]
MTENNLCNTSERRHRCDVQCAKCEHLNPRRSNVCSECGAHLYVHCHHCGHRNQRMHEHCTHCGRLLHRSFWQRWRKKLLPFKRKAIVWQVPLLVVAVFLAYKIIVKLAEWPDLFSK